MQNILCGIFSNFLEENLTQCLQCTVSQSVTEQEIIVSFTNKTQNSDTESDEEEIKTTHEEGL